MRYIRTLLCFLLFATPLFAQDDAEEAVVAKSRSAASRTGVFRGYSGGMMLHLGYQFGQAVGFPDAEGNEHTLRSVTYGIGGALRIHLLNHLRVGAEGYVSTMPLKSQGDGSNIRSGWGGVLADAYTTWGKCQPFIGGTLGGGAQRCTHVFSGEQPSIEGFADAWNYFKNFSSSQETYPAEFTKRGFFAFDPFLGIEYAATQKLHLIFKADYLICVHGNRMMTPSGPRLYVGLMFTH